MGGNLYCRSFCEVIIINLIEIYKRIAEDMNLFIDQKLKHIKRDRTFKARITEKVCDGKYTIIYQNRCYTARCPAELTAGETVYVCAPDNNWSELFINLSCGRREFEAVRNQYTLLYSDLAVEAISLGTILDFYNKNWKSHNNAFVILTHFPSDVPAQVEGHIQFLRDQSGARAVVLYYSYNHSDARIWRRSIFNGSWREDGWILL